MADVKVLLSFPSCHLILTQIWKVKEDSKGVFQGVEDKPFTVLTGKNGHKSGVVAVEFSADSKRAVTTAKDGTFKFWNLEGDYRGGFEPTVLFTGAFPTLTRLVHLSQGSNPENTPYTRALVSPTDRFVAFSFGRTVHVWTLSSAPALLLNLKNCHGGEILDLAWSPKGSLLATVSADAHVRLFRLTEDQEH